MSSSGIVKSVLSSDTIVLFGEAGSGIPKERVIRLEGLVAPRLGSRDRQDEPFAFEAREALRALLVGKPVTVTVRERDQAGSIEYGSVSHGAVDVALEMVRQGWAKVRESSAKVGEEETARRAALKAAEDEARSELRGQFGSASHRDVEYSMPLDPVAFLAEHKHKPLDAVIEAVVNGGTVRARLLISPTQHQYVQIGLAGVRAPRSGNASDGSAGEPFGDEARYFLEQRVLQRKLKVVLIALPPPRVVPVAFGADAPAPVAATLIYGLVLHAKGNIATFLLAEGLAKVLPIHAGFISQASSTLMAELRAAESTAKAARKGVWHDLPVVAAVTRTAKEEQDRKFEGIVTRVYGADMLGIVPNGTTVERKIQLASIRQPRPSDPAQAGLQADGKELLRKKLIGKPVSVLIDYVKPAEDQYEARECATVKLPNGSNVGELLAINGLVSVVRHRQTDENRASDYDRLMAAEAKAIAESKGVHSGKSFPAARIIDASESAQKAAPFLSSFKRAGRTAAVVDFVASGSRFKVLVPKESAKLTLVLEGIRCPRTARNANEKSEPFGVEAAVFVSRKVLQRDVEILISAADKTGGFIGRMAVQGQDVAVMLVREGLAKVDEYSSSKELLDAQEEAKRAGKGMWKDFDGEAEAVTNGKLAAPVVASKEYVDIVISDIRASTDSQPFSFAVQVLDPQGTIPELEKLMGELNASDDVPAPFVPRMNDVVTCIGSDKLAYRARVRRCNPARKEVEVLYIDYGNSEIVPFSRLRPLATEYKTLAGQAKEATLSFVFLLGAESEYGAEALDRFRDLCEGRQLVANIDHREASVLHLSLFDPNELSGASPESSINVQLVAEGLARVDTKSKLRDVAPKSALSAATTQAKRSRSGAYELGDVFDE